MLNRLNIFSWSNILVRALIGFGLIFVVDYIYSAHEVSRWIVLITLVSIVNTFDGLVSQYYFRVFIKKNHKIKNFYHEQSAVYLLFGFICFLFSFLVLNLAIADSLLMFIFVFIKSLDSRSKAALENTVIQRTDLFSNGVICILLIGISITQLDYNFFQTFYLGIIVLSTIFRAFYYQWFAQKKIVVYYFEFIDFKTFLSRNIDLLKTLILSSSGALIINISLLIINQYSGDDSVIALLLSYRFLMLVCEIGSIPVVSRVPFITKLIHKGEYINAIRVFEKNKKISLFIMIFGFLSVIIAGDYILSIISGNLRISTPFILAVASAGWVFERLAMFEIQLQMSRSEFSLFRLYVFYPLGIIAIVTTTLFFGLIDVFPVLVLLINLYYFFVIYKLKNEGGKMNRSELIGK